MKRVFLYAKILALLDASFGRYRAVHVLVVVGLGVAIVGAV
jgi:uncharacterized membrane protein